RSLHENRLLHHMLATTANVILLTPLNPKLAQLKELDAGIVGGTIRDLTISRISPPEPPRA
ncbi:hypothetical protein, partial [Caballeronia sp. GaOx3]|uniref:hypothetical protein n=1 Tax=Caballeronia sp. GaOx3 TaxID=2921740 RepID=UPI0020293810